MTFGQGENVICCKIPNDTMEVYNLAEVWLTPHAQRINEK